MRDDAVAAPLELTVPSDLAGLRFDQALARLVPQHSRSRLKDWIDAGRVTLDGAIAEGKRRLSGGERIVIEAVQDALAVADAPQAIEVAIVHEDEAIIVVDKPPGLVVHPGSGNRDGTLLNALLHHAPQLAALPRAGIVHRLDKDTSGLLVVAKTAIAQTDLVRQLQARTVKREYIALVHGDVSRAITIDAPIGRHPRVRTTMAVVARGRPARTHVKPLERYGAATLVQCTLETGRTHQIRVHLAAIDHPLVGDPAYGRRRGSAALPAFHRQALHAIRLAFIHPETKKRRQWETSLPDDMERLLSQLRTNKQ
ncbi:MAG TPA: RluA family pseudouridine synthase [Casimicrobiaceae bacterium]|nr:RluA family pseudouridine synthase [Casimicrobiaceae bacterium]